MRLRRGEKEDGEFIGRDFSGGGICLLLGKGMGEQGDALQTDIAARVLRFHVFWVPAILPGIRNWDEGQRRSWTVLKSKLKKTENRDETELLVKEDAITDIIRVAQETLEQNGCSYPVSAGAQGGVVSGKKLWKIYFSRRALQGPSGGHRRRSGA